jgi:excisionase family DNA binding protein
VVQDLSVRILLRVPEAAERVALSRATMYEEIRKGCIPVVRVGKSVRIRVTDLETWVESKALAREG